MTTTAELSPPWRSMDTAPKEPVRTSPPHDGIPWVDAYGPELALLCWNHDAPVLIRAAWHMRDGRQGQWRDLDCGDCVDLQMLGWVLLPSRDELAAMGGTEARGDK